MDPRPTGLIQQYPMTPRQWTPAEQEQFRRQIRAAFDGMIKAGETVAAAFQKTIQQAIATRVAVEVLRKVLPKPRLSRFHKKRRTRSMTGK